MTEQIKAQVAGYEWALNQERASEYNELASYDAFAVAFPDATGGEDTTLWEAWEQGVEDAKNLIREDAYMSISEAAEMASVGRQYVKDEVRAGRLPAMKVGRQYAIHSHDFKVWMRNPARGSRTNK